MANTHKNLLDFRKYSISRTENGVQIKLNFTPLGNALDEAQLALDRQVWADMSMYMPFRGGEGGESLIGRTGLLNKMCEGQGMVYVYDPATAYGHYQYMGEKYIDPKYKVGGFFGILEGKEGQWWSRVRVKKIPSGEPLHYTNPNAVSMWDVEAIENHGDQWLQMVKKILERGT